MKIILVNQKIEYGKRFYHGHEFRDNCPKCDTEIVKGTDQYLNYPIVGKPMDLWFYCKECKHDWSHKIKLTLKIEHVVEKSERKSCC